MPPLHPAYSFVRSRAHIIGFGLVALLAVPACDAGSAETSNSGGESETGAPLPEFAQSCPFVCEAAHDDAFADCVHVYEPGLSSVDPGTYNHAALPGVVLGPPAGALDTVSLGCGGVLVLGFEGGGIVDGEGADFIVFENPFDESFPEPARVEVSDDGCEWTAFDCDPLSLEGCAGVAQVLALPGSDLDPQDPNEAGGDAFDLSEIGVSQAHFVRIVDVSEAYWAAQGVSYCDPGQGGKGGHDLDAVAVVHRG